MCSRSHHSHHGGGKRRRENVVVARGGVALQPHPPNSFGKEGSLCGLRMFSHSGIKYYAKVFLPEYYLNTSYNNIAKLPVNREGK